MSPRKARGMELLVEVQFSEPIAHVRDPIGPQNRTCPAHDSGLNMASICGMGLVKCWTLMWLTDMPHVLLLHTFYTLILFYSNTLTIFFFYIFVLYYFSTLTLLYF